MVIFEKVEAIYHLKEKRGAIVSVPIIRLYPIHVESQDIIENGDQRKGIPRRTALPIHGNEVTL